MLLQIRNYIRREGTVNTQQLTREFHLDLQALQPMLDLWIGKKVIRKCQERSNCQSTCFKCQTHSSDYYQYLF